MAKYTLKSKIAPAAVITAGICWGVISLFSTPLANAGLSALQITEVRCITTACAFLLYLLICARGHLKIKLRDLWLFGGTGICSIAFFNVCYFISIRLCGVSASCVLLYTAPCFVMLMSCLFFREKFTARKLTALILAFGGCVLAVGLLESGVSVSAGGVIAGVASGFGYALYSIFGKLALRKYSWQTVITYTFVVCALALLPFCKIGKIFTVIASAPSLSVSALLLGIVSTLTPFLLYTFGLEYMDAGKAALLTFVEPAVAAIVGILFFKDHYSVLTVFGIVLMLVSLAILNLRPAAKK